MEDRKEKYLEGNALGIIIIGIMFGTVTCLIPVWSIKIFILNLFITLTGIIVSRYWYKTIDNYERYNSLTSYIGFIIGMYFLVMLLLRITYPTVLFWQLLILYVFTLVYSLIKGNVIFPFLNKWINPKFIKWIITILGVSSVISAFIFRKDKDILILHFIKEYGIIPFIGFSIVFAASIMLTFFGSTVKIREVGKQQIEIKKKKRI